MEFNTAQWIPVVGILLAPSIIMVAVMLVLSGFAPELAERAKANIPNIFLGIVLISVAGALATAFITAAGGAAASLPIMPMVETVSSFI